MNKKAIMLSLAMAATANTALAVEKGIPSGVPALDHVFLIVMENHGYSQIINNPNAPFINGMAKSANLATNYFAVGHPSLTNYLEIVGGSNFGVQSDNDPDWHNTACTTNLASGVPATDNPATPPICPIAGTGVDGATPPVDTTNETQGLPGLINIDGKRFFAPAPTSGKTIADQLVAKGLTWKSYQESLPPQGADLITYSDGVYSNTTDFSQVLPALTPPLTSDDVVRLYAAKHNPFVYFKNVQDGTTPGLGLANTVGFDGLFADLGAGSVPNFSLIVPNQCNDQHGRGNAGAFCNFDPKSDGSQSSLNPSLIYRGDVAVRTLVNAIHNSPVWNQGRNAIILVWDENDYSTAPNVNQVILIVDTNYGSHGLTDRQFYTHFSLLKTIEAGFGLPCLNHACDSSAPVISSLFAGK